MNKEKKPMYKVSVGAFYYALNTSNTIDGLDPEKYGDIVKSPVIKNVGVSDESENTKIYSSGIIYGSRSESSGTDIGVEVIAFDSEDLYALRGETIEENGLAFGGGSPERPYVAIGYPIIKDGGHKKMVWYPFCQLIENTDEIATKEESYSEQTDTLTFTAMPFNDAGNIKVEIDTETEKGAQAKEEEFFKQVITKTEDYVPGA